MADSKLRKHAAKAADLVAVRRAELDDAVSKYGEAERAYAIAHEAAEQEEALKTAHELRAKKTS